MPILAPSDDLDQSPITHTPWCDTAEHERQPGEACVGTEHSTGPFLAYLSEPRTGGAEVVVLRDGPWTSLTGDDIRAIAVLVAKLEAQAGITR